MAASRNLLVAECFPWGFTDELCDSKSVWIEYLFSNTTEYSNANFLDAEPGKHSLLILDFFQPMSG